MRGCVRKRKRPADDGGGAAGYGLPLGEGTAAASKAEEAFAVPSFKEHESHPCAAAAQIEEVEVCQPADAAAHHRGPHRRWRSA